MKFVHDVGPSADGRHQFSVFMQVRQKDPPSTVGAEGNTFIEALEGIPPDMQAGPVPHDQSWFLGGYKEQS